MQALSTTMATALAAGNKQRVLLQFTGGTTFSNEDVSATGGVKFTYEFNSETDLKIGLCPSAQIQFSLLNENDALADFEFGRFTAYLGVMITDGTPAAGAKTRTFVENGISNLYEFVPMGTFIAERPDIVRKTIIDVTGNDLMTLFDEDMPSATDLGLTYPTTIGGIFEAMCTYLSVSPKTTTFTNSTLPVSKQPDAFKDATMREVLGWIAEAAGCNARFTRGGLLEFAWFSTVSKTYSETNYSEFSHTWYEAAAVDGLHIRNSAKNNEYTTGTDDNPYLISENPFLIPGNSTSTASVAGTAILQSLSSVPAFHPVSAELFSDWRLEPGDMVTMTSGNDTYTVPVYSMDITWNGDAKVTAESTGNQKREPLPAMQRRSYGTSRRMQSQEDRTDGIDARLVENEADIGLVVTRTEDGRVVNVASIVASINEQDGQYQSVVRIDADKININGDLTLHGMLYVTGGASYVNCGHVVTGDIEVSDITATYNQTTSSYGEITWGDTIIGAHDIWIDQSSVSDAVSGFGTPVESGGQISIPFYRVNRAVSSSDVINFNIAATQYYQDGVAAAYAVTDSQINLQTQTPQGTQPTSGVNIGTFSAASYASHQYVPITVTVHGHTKRYYMRITA